MKSWTLAGCSLVLVGLTSSALAAPQDNGAATPPPSAPATIGTSVSLDPDLFEDNTSSVDLSQATLKPLSGAKPLPANVPMSGPAAEIMKLASAGVQADVMLAFVKNCPARFDLSADQIVYLNDLGVPNTVVMAMLQHDQGLGAPAPDYGQPQPPPTYTQTQPAPETAPATPPPAPDQSAEPNFYDSLSPYGNWLDAEGYGPVWQPTVATYDPYWQPYYDGGYWVNSDCGWYWMSDYSWGWAPFHYGRWFHHSHYGWCWAPGRVWSPAWVCWRSSNQYCGWAPLPPGAWYQSGVGLVYHGRRVGLGFDFGIGMNFFAYVDMGHFNSRHLREHPLPRETVARFYHSSSVSAPYGSGRHGIINHGVSPTMVAAATHSQLSRVSIQEARGPHAGNGRFEHLSSNGQALNVYRPRVTSAPRPTAATPSHLRSETNPYGSQRNYVASGARPSAATPWGTGDPWHRGNAARPQPELRGNNQPVSPGDSRSMAAPQPQQALPFNRRWQGNSDWGRSASPQVRSFEGGSAYGNSGESSRSRGLSDYGRSSRSFDSPRSFSAPAYSSGGGGSSAPTPRSAPSYSGGSSGSSSRSSSSSSSSSSGSGRSDRNPR